MADRKNNETTSWNADEVRRQQTQRKQRKKMRRTRFWAIYCAGVVLGSCLLAGLGWLMVNDVCALNKAPLTATVEIEKGDSVGQIASKLKKAGIIKYKLLFVITSPLFHAKDTIQPGSYELNTDMDYNCIIDSMQQGSSVAGTVKVTIPEGYTVQETIELLASKGVGTVEELTDACANYPFEDYTFLDSSKLGDISRMEGFLYPDTHEFYTGKAVLAIDTLLYAFQMQISEQMQADIQKSGYSLSEIVTMASMIEKESINDDAERKNIASVLYNRMNNSNGETAGFLQVDATIDYALKLQGKDHSSFTTSLDSPYNTYLHKGLPAGPICSPSLSSIKAAIYPNQTDYYFYALGKDGVHHFFKTYAEHLNFINSSDYQSIG